MILTILRVAEQGLIDHDFEIIDWLENHTAGGAQAYFSSSPGNPEAGALVAFAEEADAILFKIVFADELAFL